MNTLEHRERVLAAMRDDGIDVLLLGREANARYVSGADRLWLAGTRPFAPGCVVVGSTGDVYLLSITDDGIPDDVSTDRLYPISWNPLAMLAQLATIDGVAGARRVGVDGMTPLFEQLITAVLGHAALVDGEALLRRVRRRKSSADVAGIAAAVDAAETALAATDDALVAGISEIELQGVFEEAMTASGLTAPAFEGTFCVDQPGSPTRVFSTDRAVTDGDLVHVRAGVMRDGWEGVVARTLRCGSEPVRSTHLTDFVARCTAGASVGAVRSAGVSLEGTGMGHEEVADDEQLEDGMVVVIEHAGNDVLDGAVVHVAAGGPEVLAAR